MIKCIGFIPTLLSIALISCIQSPQPTALQPASTLPSTTTPLTASAAPSTQDLSLEYSVALGHGKLEAVTLSHNQEALAIASSSQVVLYDSDTLEQRWEVTVEGQTTEAVSWYRDDTQILVARSSSAGAGLTIYSLNSADGSLLHSFSISPSAEASFSPDGSLVVVSQGLPNGTSSLYDTETGMEVGTLDMPIESGRIVLLAWSPDSRHIAYGNTNGEVIIWNIDSREREQVRPDDVGLFISSVAFSLSGKELFISSIESGTGNINADQKASSEVWDIASGTTIWKQPILLTSPIWLQSEDTILAKQLANRTDMGIVRLDSHTGQVLEQAQNRSGAIVQGSTGKIVNFDSDALRLLDEKHLTVLAETGGYVDLLGDTGRSYATFSRNGEAVATASRSGVIIWNSSEGKEIYRFSGPSGPSAWSPDGNHLAVRDHLSGTVTIYDISNKNVFNEIPTNLSGSGLLEWLTSDRILASGKTQDSAVTTPSPSGAMPQTLYLIDPNVGSTIYQTEVPNLSETAFATNPEGTEFAYTLYELSGGGTTIISNTQSGEIIREFKSEINYPVVLAWSPDGQRLAANPPPQLVVWNIQTGETDLTLGASDQSQIQVGALGWISPTMLVFIDQLAATLTTVDTDTKQRSNQRVSALHNDRFVRTANFEQRLILIEDSGGTLTLWKITE